MIATASSEHRTEECDNSMKLDFDEDLNALQENQIDPVALKLCSKASKDTE
jgi:hypothetical protein